MAPCRVHYSSLICIVASKSYLEQRTPWLNKFELPDLAAVLPHSMDFLPNPTVQLLVSLISHLYILTVFP